MMKSGPGEGREGTPLGSGDQYRLYDDARKDEEKEFLRNELEMEGDEVMDRGGATPIAAGINLFNCAVGAGVLSLPGAFQNMGLGLALGAFFLLGVLALYSLNTLVNDTIVVGAKSYDALVYRLFGRKVMVAFQIVVILYTFGVCVGYVIIIGDLLPELFQNWAGISKYESGGWFLTPEVIELLVVVFFLAPLSSLSRIDNLKYASSFALVGVMYFTIVTIVKDVEFIQSPSFKNEKVVWAEGGSGFFRGIPIIAFALGGHVQCVSVYHELKPQHRTQQTFLLISSGMVAVLSTIYLLVSVLSYLHFLPNNGNILQAMLEEYPGEVSIEISSLMMSLVVIFSYPLLSFPLRLSIEDIIFKGKTPTIGRIAITVAILFFSYLVAVVVGNLEVVFGLTGAVGATLVKFVFPAALHLSLHYKGMIKLPVKSQILPYFLVICGLVVGVVSVFFIIKDAID